MNGKKNISFRFIKYSLLFMGLAAVMQTAGASGVGSMKPFMSGRLPYALFFFANDGDNHSAQKAMAYTPVSIYYLTPAEILPIVGQIEAGDKKAYEHIEHLRIAEAKVIAEMMRRYGAGKYDTDEYKEFMGRLNTGMIGETPKGYDNYESVGGTVINNPTDHAHNGYFILDTLVNHANFKVINPNSTIRYIAAKNMCELEPNKIHIMGLSMGGESSKEEYNSRNMQPYKELDLKKNRLMFCAGGNTKKKSGIIKNRLHQEDVEGSDIHSVYDTRSRAHGKNDETIDRHCMVTVGTDKTGDVDQTDWRGNGSKFPVGFHDKVLFSGRIFPYFGSEAGKVRADDGKYDSSYVNYVNVAMTDLCFQMRADVENVDELLDKIWNTALVTDTIRCDGMKQALQLINPGGFFRKYLLPENLPTEVHPSGTVALEKGFYKGVIFNIPGAQVKVNGTWMAFDASNAALIKAQNPFTLEWRIDGSLCQQYGYTEGQTITGTVISVDDEWNGLTDLGKTFTVKLTSAATGIQTLDSDATMTTVYNLQGMKVATVPSVNGTPQLQTLPKGIYIINGKVIIR